MRGLRGERKAQLNPGSLNPDRARAKWRRAPFIQ
jgi:hypothetical protein